MFSVLTIAVLRAFHSSCCAIGIGWRKKAIPCLWQVRDVRTTDDTLLTVKLMIFFELKDIIEMVRMVHGTLTTRRHFPCQIIFNCRFIHCTKFFGGVCLLII